jgi:hypothetical protein
MEQYSTLQHFDPHTVTMGVTFCLAALAVAVGVVVKLFRSF